MSDKRGRGWPIFKVESNENVNFAYTAVPAGETFIGLYQQTPPLFDPRKMFLWCKCLDFLKRENHSWILKIPSLTKANLGKWSGTSLHNDWIRIRILMCW